MKLRTKLSLITAAAMMAFTGAGFAAWTFTNTVNDSATVNAGVTCAIEADNVKVFNGVNEIDTLYVILDAPTSGSGNRKAGEGIFYSSTADGANKITSLTLKGEIKHHEEDLHYGDLSEKVLFTKAETDQLAATGYVNFTAGSLTNAEQDVVVGTTVYTATYNLPTYAYVAAELPDSVAEVDAMQAAMVGKTLSLAFTFGIKA